MKIDKRVSLTGEAPYCPIELSDVVVGMGQLGWTTQRQDLYEIRRTAWWKWPVWLLGGPIVRWQMRRSERVKRYFEVEHWIKASIEETGAERTLVLHGNAGLRDARRIDDLCQSLARGRRWLTPDALVTEGENGGAPEQQVDQEVFGPDPR